MLSLDDAMDFVPTVPTYAIRINGYGRMNWDYEKFKLQESGLWVAVNEYVFDDIDKGVFTGLRPGEGKAIDEETANRVVSDFIPYHKTVQALLVHCMRGKNRSSGLLLGMNDVFGLGVDREKFLCEKRLLWEMDVNQLVYEKIVESGKRLIVP